MGSPPRISIGSLIFRRTPGRITVYVYELDPALRAYTSTGIFHNRLKLVEPFDLDVDLTEIDQL